MVVGRLPALFMDEISTGLDSASTFLISKSLRNLAHFININIVVALLQPSPETYEVYDDLLLLAEGKIMFHGPREEALPFINSLGLVCPPRKAVADFLQEITSRKDQAQYWGEDSTSHPFLTVDEISKAFQSSQEGLLRSEELKSQISPSDMDLMLLKKDKYALPSREIFSNVIAREFLLLVRLKAFVIIRAFQTVVISVIIGTTFLQYPKSTFQDASYYMSVCFFTLMFNMMGGFAEIPIMVERLPVFYKQRDCNFFPAYLYCAAGMLSRVPDSWLMATLMTVLVYWLVGFAANAGQFFIFYLIVFCMTILSTSLFRTIAAITRVSAPLTTCHSLT